MNLPKPGSSHRFSLIKLLVVCSLFLSFLFFFLKVDLWDYDFWWHAATGRYIVTENRLPDSDPFSYTSTLMENKNPFPERETFLLKQYWLAQVIFYLVFQNAGPAGMIILRTALLMLMLIAVFMHLNRKGTSLYIGFIFIFVLFMISTRSTGERPVLFSILFTALAFSLLDNFFVDRSKKLFLLVPIMLIWANMHGGFVIGDIIIAVFMTVESIRLVFRKTRYSRNELQIFLGAGVLAILASFVNPTGWDAFFMSFSSRYNVFAANIQEWQSPLFFYRHKIRPFDYWYAFLVLLFLLVLVIRNRKLDLSHLILLSGMLYMSLTSSRFITFYAIVATMVLGKETDSILSSLIRKRLSEKLYFRLEYVLAAIALCSALMYMYGTFPADKIRLKVAQGASVPVAAVDFIESSKIDGNMFNDYGYGGYLAWRLYPWKKTFIDSRSLNITVMTEYDWIMDRTASAKEVAPSASNTPLWQRLLSHYQINFMFLSPFSIYDEIRLIIFELIEHDKWVPVYHDLSCIVFVKNIEQNMDIISKHRVTKEAIYEGLIYKSSFEAATQQTNPRPLLSLGEIFNMMGRTDDAVRAYELALERMPESPFLKKRLEELTSGHETKK